MPYVTQHFAPREQATPETASWGEHQSLAYVGSLKCRPVVHSQGVRGERLFKTGCRPGQKITKWGDKYYRHLGERNLSLERYSYGASSALGLHLLCQIFPLSKKLPCSVFLDYWHVQSHPDLFLVLALRHLSFYPLFISPCRGKCSPGFLCQTGNSTWYCDNQTSLEV